MNSRQRRGYTRTVIRAGTTRYKAGPPPPNLVPLSSLPRELWLGREVFEPDCVIGGTPYWREVDVPAPYADVPSVWSRYYAYNISWVTAYVADDPDRVRALPTNYKGEPWLGYDCAAQFLFAQPL